MLYLIRAYGPGRKQSILKIGFTDDIEKRLSQYFSSNPYTLVIATREGDLILESLIHKYLYSLGLRFSVKDGNRKRLEEWFEDKPEVLHIFHLSREAIEKLVWRNWDKIFNIKSSNDSRDYSLFKYLYNKHINEFHGTLYKVEGKRIIKTNAKEVDVDFWRVHTKNLEDTLCPIEGIDEAYRPVINDFMNAFISTNLFVCRMRMYCEFMDANKDDEFLTDIIDHCVCDPKFRNYYNLFGTSGCRAVGFQEARIIYMMNDLMKKDQLREAIVKKFPIKMRISKKKAKGELGEIYNSLGINATPKATEIENYLELREVKIPEGGKRVNGYEIIALK